MSAELREFSDIHYYPFHEYEKIHYNTRRIGGVHSRNGSEKKPRHVVATQSQDLQLHGEDS